MSIQRSKMTKRINRLVLGHACAVFAASVVVSAQVPAKKQDVIVTKTSGGSVQTKLSANIRVNEQSTVNREWIALHDPSLPADLVDTPGVTTVYVPDRASGNYQYEAKTSLQAKEGL